MWEAQFHEFFDDAAIFPPGLAPLNVAVREHIRRSEDEVARKFIGPLILPLAQVREAVSLAAGNPLTLSVIVVADELESVDKLLEDLVGTGASVSTLEVKLSDGAAAAIATAADVKFAHPELKIFLELPYADITEENLAALQDAGLDLKFRTGGIKQELFPTSEQLVDVLSQAVAHGIAFKLTAGLHRAMRYTDENTGFHHFGFANIAAATTALKTGASKQEAQNLLDSNDSVTVTEALRAEDGWRESFTAFGTCSVVEPAETLVEIGLIDADTATRF